MPGVLITLDRHDLFMFHVSPHLPQRVLLASVDLSFRQIFPQLKDRNERPTMKTPPSRHPAVSAKRKTPAKQTKRTKGKRSGSITQLKVVIQNFLLDADKDRLIDRRAKLFNGDLPPHQDETDEHLFCSLMESLSAISSHLQAALSISGENANWRDKGFLLASDLFQRSFVDLMISKEVESLFSSLPPEAKTMNGKTKHIGARPSLLPGINVILGNFISDCIDEDAMMEISVITHHPTTLKTTRSSNPSKKTKFLLSTEKNVVPPQ